MVLDNATAPESAFAADSPSSDLDQYADTNIPYSSSQEPSHVQVAPPPYPVYINLNDLPRRVSLFGTKPHHPALVNTILDSARFASSVLQRPVTQDEANALAYHLAKSLRIGSYGTPAGVVLGTAFAVRSQKTYGFPFWSPFGKDGKSGRLSPDVFGPLKGQYARAVWQSLRFSTYWLVGAAFCNLFFGSYALTVHVADRMLDPRLKDFNEVMKARARDRNGREAMRREMAEAPGPKKDNETFDMARQRRSAQEWGRQARQKMDGRVADDASPTGGAFSDDYVETPGAGSFQTDAQAQQHHSELQTELPEPQTRQTRQPNKPLPVNKPSAGAWDRLRSDAMSDSPSKPAPRMSTAPSASSTAPSDSFAFSSEDRDKQLPKVEAQKQFDARIEREREGRDFNEGGRRW